MRQFLLKNRLIDRNFSKREDKIIEYIVINDTGNTNKGASLDRHYKFFQNSSNNAIYHYLIGNEAYEYKIYNFVNEENKTSYCENGTCNYGITDENSIVIGICVNSDSDYKNNIIGLARFAADLLIKYDLNIDRLVRKYDVNREICPKSMSYNDWYLWNGFYDLTNTIVNWLQSGANVYDINNALLEEYKKFQNKYLEAMENIKLEDTIN